MIHVKMRSDERLPFKRSALQSSFGVNVAITNSFDVPKFPFLLPHRRRNSLQKHNR